MSDELIQQVWGKAEVVPGYDSDKFRKDQCGAWITRSEYGNRNSSYGWEVDHITPVSDGGGEELSNLRPLQHENNSSRQDGRLTCPVTSSGNQNIKS